MRKRHSWAVAAILAAKAVLGFAIKMREWFAPGLKLAGADVFKLQSPIKSEETPPAPRSRKDLL
jgi:hypothetical protein